MPVLFYINVCLQLGHELGYLSIGKLSHNVATYIWHIDILYRKSSISDLHVSVVFPESVSPKKATAVFTNPLSCQYHHDHSVPIIINEWFYRYKVIYQCFNNQTNIVIQTIVLFCLNLCPQQRRQPWISFSRYL